MNNSSKYLVGTVCVDKLKTDMTILAYTGFSKQYQKINAQVCGFLHLNFAGSKALVLRDNIEVEVFVEDIRTGDSILKIFSFPKTKEKLTKVNPQLVAALKKRGMLTFSIKKPDFAKIEANEIESNRHLHHLGSSKKNSQRLVQGIELSNQLVERVRSCKAQHDEGTCIVENLMDKARSGRVCIQEIENYVERIVRNSSTEAMAAIINLRASDQTYSHCIDVGVLFQHLYFNHMQQRKKRSVFQTKNQALLGAFLHDFGKSQLPKEILDSKARFGSDSKEMEMMRSHPYYGAKLLKTMNMPNTIINMSLCHHIKMDETLNTSYPSKISYEDLNFESRLLALVDIYQALVGKRSYKRSWTPPQAMRYLSALVGIEYTPDIWDLFLKLMGEYPIGSLVVLSDDSMGFVMNVPKEEEDLLRPLVALIRNADGEDLENNPLVDLQIEKDLRITNDLDVLDVLSGNALDEFSEMKIVA